MSPPRFLLVIESTNTFLRAALVTRELKIVASARQSFQVIESSSVQRAFDPLEVWYKTKQVIAACSDIGRTLPREIIALALVGQGNEAIAWFEQNGETHARGIFLESQVSPEIFRKFLSEFRQREQAEHLPLYLGSMSEWVLWNLTGAYVEIRGWRLEEELNVVMPRRVNSTDVQAFGKSRARAPLNAELPVAVVLDEKEALERGKGHSQADAMVLGTAEIALRVK
ncbi:MAG TPA: hypothetical protein VFD70_30085 [Anaerolineae bacterium]|nr:hypothetical protein [Anaerolineae bacterium]